jgi:hypothetical protein
MESAKELVELFVRNALTPRGSDDDDLVATLLAEGIDSESAERLLAFVPIGFAHVFLGDLGVGLPDGFAVQDPATGRNSHGKLRDEPIFSAACACARAMISSGPDEERAAREVAGRSAEWNVIEQLTRDGSDPSQCGLTESVLLRFPPGYASRRAAARRSWWRFWGGSG